jgi:rhodanese-related sulfurtransferase
MNKQIVDYQALQELISAKADLILLDVRDEEKYQTGTLQTSQYEIQNIPYLIMKEKEEPIDQKMAQLWKDKQIVTLCTSGNKAQKAAALLRENGFQAVALLGGLTAWNENQKNHRK